MRIQATNPVPATPKAPPAPAASPETLEPRDVLEKAGRVAAGVGGGLLGAAAGAATGIPLGIGLGAVQGVRGGSPMEFEILQPMQSVAGLGGVAAHKFAEKSVGRLLGERAGRIAGAVAGGIVGAATGAVIGAIGMAVAGGDAGARLGLKGASALLGPAPQKPDTDPRPSYERGRGPQVPTPDGNIRQDQHHFLYNNAAMTVLAADAAKDPFMAKIHTFLTSDPALLDQMQMGGWNMDTFLGSPLPHVNLSTFHHFEEPFMPGMKSAGWQARQAYDKAVDCWKAGDRRMAVYYLGASVHLAQDVALPQHAVKGVGFVGKMAGHQMMEEWAESQAGQLNPPAALGGIYLQAAGPEEFVATVAAAAAADYGSAVKDAGRYVGHRREKARAGKPTDPPSQSDFQSETYKTAWQRAVRITPGFFRMFFEDVERQGYPI